MGTRSLTRIKDDDGKELCCIYQQFDGYPSGVGAILHDLLKDMTIINGISEQEMGKFANGMDCLAAQIVAKRKDKIGNVYIYPPGVSDVGEQYVYTIYPGSKLQQQPNIWSDYRIVNLKVEESYSGTVLYDGPAKDFDPMMQEKAEATANE